MSSLAATMATRQEHARAHKRAVSQTSADTRAQMPRGTRRCRHFVANRAGVSLLALCVSRVTSALEQQKLARAWSTPNEQRHEVNKRTVDGTKNRPARPSFLDPLRPPMSMLVSLLSASASLHKVPTLTLGGPGGVIYRAHLLFHRRWFVVALLCAVV